MDHWLKNEFLTYGIDICQNRFDVNDSLSGAIAEENAERVELFLHPDLKIRDTWRRWFDAFSHVQMAVARENPAVLRLILQGSRGLVNLDDEGGRKGEALLHAAASAGDAKIIQVLLEEGARLVTGQQTKGKIDGNERLEPRTFPVLHTAARCGHVEAVQALLRGGADIEARCSQGQTALMTAAAQGKRDVIRCLAQAGADIHAKDHLGDTALHLALTIANSPWRRGYPIEAHLAAVRELLALGAAVNEPDGMERTPLDIAMDITKGARVDRDVVTVLLDHDAELTCNKFRINNRTTKLHSAVHSGKDNVALLLCSRGADPSLSDRSGISALELAKERKTCPSFVKWCEDPDLRRKRNQKNIYFFNAVKTGRIREVSRWLGLGININTKNADGTPALIQAIMTANSEVVKELVERGADIHVTNTAGRTALWWAARLGREDLTPFLLQRGARADEADNCDDTPVYVAQKFCRSRQSVPMLRASLASKRTGVDTPAAPVPEEPEEDWELVQEDKTAPAV